MKDNHINIALAGFQYLTQKGLESIIAEKDGFSIGCVIAESDDLPENIINDADVLVFGLHTEDMLPQIEFIAQNHSIQLLIITEIEKADLIHQLTKYGIRSIISRSCNEHEFNTALKSISRGQRFYCNKILDLMLEPQNEPEVKVTSKLSPREIEVLTLIAEGKTTEAISNKLHISVHTVNSHRKNILKKLNISSPIQLVAYALEVGLVSYEFKK